MYEARQFVVSVVPFLAGTITQSILLGKNHSPVGSTLVLALSMVITVAVVLLFKLVRDHLKARQEKVLDRYVNILARVNGLLIGAISTEMVVSETRQVWLEG